MSKVKQPEYVKVTLPDFGGGKGTGKVSKEEKAALDKVAGQSLEAAKRFQDQWNDFGTDFVTQIPKKTIDTRDIQFGTDIISEQPTISLKDIQIPKKFGG